MFSKFLNRIDTSQNQRKIIFIFLFIWLIVNIIQSIFTELAHDEAYYWMYSRYLAWGYYDHPPMIAILVKIGYMLFKNELGVRLLTIFMGVTTIYFIYLLIEEQINKLSIFLIVLLSAVIIQSHIGGFLAIPDLPVVFFSVLFFLFYKKYLQNDTWWWAVILGVVGSAMLYSKYHGLLVLAFTVISNLKIFKRLTFWIIPSIIIVLLLPHLFWQIDNNFPTFQYHLVGRSSGYKFDNTFNFLYSQLLISGPLSGILLFYFTVKYKAGKDVFLRGLKFNFYGFFIFFFLSSFKGHVEPHWTAIGYVPVIIFSCLGISKSVWGQKWLKGLFIPSFIIFLLIRVALVYEIIPKEWKLGKEFHNWDTWAQQIKAEANGRKVVFVNSFQRPSKYAFYTGGDFSTSLNSVYYRRNQYDLWGFEDSIQGKPVLLMTSRTPDDSIYTATEKYRLQHFDSFRSYYSVEILPEISTFINPPDTIITLDLKLVNSTNKEIQLIQAEGSEPPSFNIVLIDEHYYLPPQDLGIVNDTIPPHDTISKKITMVVPKESGKYSGCISIVNNALFPAFNSKPIKIIIKK